VVNGEITPPITINPLFTGLPSLSTILPVMFSLILFAELNKGQKPTILSCTSEFISGKLML